MRGDTHTVNTLSAYQLGTTQSNTTQSTYYELRGLAAYSNMTVYWGIRVWKRDSSGNETEITSGTPVAQVNRTTSAAGIQSATWTPTQTSLSTTDSIVVRVYIQLDTEGWVQGDNPAIFTTEQLGNTFLDNQQWTIYYYTERTNQSTGGAAGRFTGGRFYWGTSTYNSRIENFTHYTPTVTVGTTGTQRAEIYPGSTSEYIGGAFTFLRDSGSTNVTSIKISNTGTVSDTNLSNLILYYKQEATCSSTIPGDATQFNSTAGTFTTGSSTVTGTMSVGTSQVCLYARLNVGVGAQANETIAIQITNPSTDVLVQDGVVAPATAVAINGTTYVKALGYLTVDIVDGDDVSVTSPFVDFTSAIFSWINQQTTATLGTSTQKILVGNHTPTHEWTLSIAATNGASALWESTTHSYSYNGLQSEGRLLVDPGISTITPFTGCSTTGLTKQSSAYFAEVVTSINLVIAGSSADIDCDWYITGIGLTQDIPASQPSGGYSLPMTITVM